jgi:uncharacterized protein YecA (UPF0149 family)
MDIRDGRIYESEALTNMQDADKEYMKEMEYHPTPFQRAAGRISRNDPCPCGSGKKFKRCCLFKKR